MYEGIEPILTQGPWAILSVFLLTRIFKKSDESNKQFIDLIKENQSLVDKQLESHEVTIKIIEGNQAIIKELSNRYDNIKKTLEELNIDVRQIYRVVNKEGV